jgi:hypothetical protein
MHHGHATPWAREREGASRSQDRCVGTGLQPGNWGLHQISDKKISVCSSPSLSFFPLGVHHNIWHLAPGIWHLAPGTWHIAHRKSSVTLCLPASNLGSGPKAKIAICSPLTLPLLPGPGCACRSLTIVPSVPDVPDWGMQAHTHKLPKSWECGRLLERWMSSSRLV